MFSSFGVLAAFAHASFIKSRRVLRAFEIEAPLS